MERYSKMGKYTGEENLLGVSTVENPNSFVMISNALTGQKDIDLKILGDLDDRSLINFCILGKKNGNINNLCNDATFWRNRFIEKYEPSPEWIKQQNMTTWKRNYLRLAYYLNKAEEEHTSKKGEFGYIRYKDWALYYASKDGNIDIVNFLISKGVNNWFMGLRGATESGNQFLTNFYNERKFSEFEYDQLLRWAADADNRELVDYYIGKGAKNFHSAIYGAFNNNNFDMLKYLYEKMPRGLEGLQDDLLEEYLNKSFKKYGANEISIFYFTEIKRREEEMKQKRKEYLARQRKNRRNK